MNVSHKNLIRLSGLIWFVVGFFLLKLGLELLTKSAKTYAATGEHPLLKLIAPYLGDVQAAILLLICIALAIGYFKGRYVLGKSAQKGVARIREFPNPAPLAKIYSPKYYILLALMVGLGISIKYMGLSDDIRGVIDTAIGAALLNGAMIYFRLARTEATSS